LNEYFTSHSSNNRTGVFVLRSLQSIHSAAQQTGVGMAGAFLMVTESYGIGNSLARNYRSSLMTDPLVTAESDVKAAVAWYESHLFYSGVAVGALCCFIVMQVIKHL